MKTFRLWLARQLRRLAVILEAHVNAAALERAADQAVALAEASFGREYDEAKRHFCYSTLVEQFPTVPRLSIGLEIEHAVRRLNTR